ncbi:MAG: hypothetical protein KDE53_18855, partial [Caldilineaceae bacterium]|nr:hypothetical protein [Caldilineaceae bacterium]
YNRFMYASGNPLNRADPTGHVDKAIHDSNDGPSPEWIDWEELYVYNPDQLSGEIFLWLEAHQDLNRINAMTEMMTSYFGEGHGVVSQFERTFAASFAGGELRELLNPGVYAEAALRAGSILSQVGLDSSEKNAGGTVDCSFSADTFVTTAEGLQSIATIEVDDLVLAYHELLDQQGYYPVLATMAHEDAVVVI